MHAQDPSPPGQQSATEEGATSAPPPPVPTGEGHGGFAKRAGWLIGMGVAALLAGIGALVLRQVVTPESQVAISAEPTSSSTPSPQRPASSTPTPRKTQPTKTQDTSQTKTRAKKTLDPCDGGPFPFKYALSVSPEPPDNFGSADRAVLNVQKILRSLGYTGLSRTNIIAADGWYGKHTEFAVENFQRDRGIDTTGAVYRETWLALGKAC